MKLRVHIERLVLDGIDSAAGNAARIEAAVAEELRQQLAAGAWRPGSVASGALASVPATSVEIRGKDSAPQVGRAIARALHSGLTK